MRYMYVIDINDPHANTEGMEGIFNAIFTTIDRAHEALVQKGFMVVASNGSVAYTKGDILAVISRCPVGPTLGVEEVQIR